MSQEHSAEWLRGAVAVLGRMVDDCSTVFDSDLPHITQSNLEDYLAEYGALLAAAEARESGKNAAEISADRAWIDGAKFGWNCEEKTDLHEDIANRQQRIRECSVVERVNAAVQSVKPTPNETTAAEVIAGAKKALEDIGAKLDQCKTHQLGGVGGQTTEQGVLATVYHRAPYMIRHDIYAAIEALAAWEAAQR